MSNIAIRIEGLAKQYKIGTLKYRHDTFREQLVDGLKSIFSRNGAHPKHETIWALKDVSFEVRAGETIGLIGRNGSGKSTLLKILSRITEPTLGRVQMRGRLGSLLEVGTGFDRDLTGRENIYLSGAILGMRKAEINRRFDEIVAFSEVEKFIDTPVKRYSSGMYVRLAFAVAAHLEPEILIVDEVLAVGDARFQEKCLSRMSDFGHTGRTIIFVSHNMSAITRLCERAILLEDGKVLDDGSSHKVVGKYLNAGFASTAVREWPDPAAAPQGAVARLCAVRVRTPDGQAADILDIRDPVAIDLEYEVIQDGRVLLPCLIFFNDEEMELFTTYDLDPTWRKRPRSRGRYVSTVWLPGNFLSEGRYLVDAALLALNPEIVQFHERHIVSFQVIEGTEVGEARSDYSGNHTGVVRPVFKWTTNFTHMENQRLPERIES